MWKMGLRGHKFTLTVQNIRSKREFVVIYLQRMVWNRQTSEKEEDLRRFNLYCKTSISYWIFSKFLQFLSNFSRFSSNFSFKLLNLLEQPFPETTKAILEKFKVSSRQLPSINSASNPLKKLIFSLSSVKSFIGCGSHNKKLKQNSMGSSVLFSPSPKMCVNRFAVDIGTHIKVLSIRFQV